MLEGQFYIRLLLNVIVGVMLALPILSVFERQDG